MVPPRSAWPATMSSWSAIVEMTGSGVAGSNSAELASVSPTERAASMTMHCRPRHSPSTGNPRARACRMAPILPSIPRMPNPPGISTPWTSPSAAAAPPAVSHSSDATQCISTFAWCLKPAGAQRFGDRQVGVGQLDVLAHQSNPHRLVRLVHPAQQVVPFGPVDVTERQVEPAHHEGVEFLAVQHLGDVVDRRRVRGGDDAVDVDVTHQRDLVLQRLGDVAVAAQDQRVRGDTDAAQRGHRVLGGLGLQLAGRGEVRHQRHVQKEDVLPAEVVADLAGRLQERLRLDVAHGAADFGDDDVRAVAVGVRLGHRPDAPLDLVGDVRDHLDGVAEVLAASLLGDDGRIHLPGSHIRRTGQVAIQEALVVADVEVGLGAVLGDEDLAVLERVHGARVDVEVRVELLHRHVQPAGGQ